MREEPDDASPSFQLRFQLGYEGQRLGVGVVEIEDDQRRFFFTIAAHVLGQILLGFDKLDLDVDFARNLLNFCREEQVVNEGENAGPAIGFGQRIGVRAQVIAGVKPPASPAIIAIHARAVGVVHGSGVDAAVAVPLSPSLSGTAVRWTTAAPASVSPPGSGGMVRSNHHIALFFALNSSRGKWFDALICRGNFAAGAKLSQPHCGWKSNRELLFCPSGAWSLTFWARSAG